MASDQDVVNWLKANPNATDADIASAMATAGVSPAQMAKVTGLSEGEVAARVAATVPPNQTVTLGDTIVQPNYQISGSGENQEIGPVASVITYKTSENKPGGTYQQYTPAGEFQQTGVQQKVSDPTKQILGIAVAYFVPIIGAEIAASLGTSTAVGTAIAQTAVSVAQGVPLEKAVLNAGTNLLTGSVTGTQDAKDFISGITSDKSTQDIIKNVSNSVINTVAKGGSERDILTNAVSAASGTVIGQETGSSVIGQGAGTLIATGDPFAAATSAAGTAGSEAARKSTSPPPEKIADSSVTDEFKAPSTLTARSDLVDAINKADLTDEQRKLLTSATQGSDVAQALPATVSDAGGGTTARLGLPFAANDPRFVEALKNNPELRQKFTEYTNTYGFTSPQLNVVYKTLIEAELAKDPTYQPLLDEYKKVTGTDYVAPTTDLGELTVTGKRETPTNIVVSVDPVSSKVLVIDNSGTVTSSTLAPDTVVRPGDSVTVNPTTNVVTPVTPVTPQTPTGPLVTPVPAVTPDVSPTPSVTPSVTPSTTPSTTPATVPDPNAVPSTVPSTTPSPAVNPAVTPGVTPSPTTGPLIGPAVTPRPVSPLSPVTPVTPTTPTTPTVPVVPVVPPVPPEPETPTTPPVPPEPPTPPSPPTPPTPPPPTPPVKPTTPPEEPPKPPKPPEEPPEPPVNITVSTVKGTKPKAQLPTITGFSRSPLEQALTAYRPAGEIESELGLGREDVWNEASLRLKDALGL